MLRGREVTSRLMFLLLLDSQSFFFKLIYHCSNSIFNRVTNSRNAILELNCQVKRVCVIVRLLQVPHPTISKTIKIFKKLGHEEDRGEQTEKRPLKHTENICID